MAKKKMTRAARLKRKFERFLRSPAYLEAKKQAESTKGSYEISMEECQRITAEDLAVTINARAY